MVPGQGTRKMTLASLCLLGGIAALCSSSGNAFAAKSDNLEAERQQLFDQMLQQPDNLEVALSYATLSVRVGDLEGAVSTLERLLIFRPGLASLQLELGVLYYRLGNFDTAQGYFKAVIAGPQTPFAVNKRAQEYLAAVEKRLKRFRWSAKTFVGLRWQSNANSGPDSQNITLNGVPVLLNNNAIKKSDFGLIGQSRAHFEYDLHTQGDKLELDYVDYANLHFNQSRFDAAVAEATFGPAFNLGRFNIDETFASIYAIVNGAFLNDKVYFGTLGIGSRIVSRPNRKTELVLRTEFRRQWFNNSATRPLASRRNGNEYRVLGQVAYQFSRDVRGMFDARLSRKDRKVNFFDYWEYGVQAKFDWALTPTQMSKEHPWVLTARAGYVHRDYDGPDPTINATRTQQDDEFWLGATLKVPLNKSWAVMPKLEYRNVNSNNPLRDFDGFSATIGVQFEL